jgi:ubiquinone/menaquinone biosynthesis C-methylase UbiE
MTAPSNTLDVSARHKMPSGRFDGLCPHGDVPGCSQWLLENSVPDIKWEEYDQTKTPRYVKPFMEKLLPEVKALEPRLPTPLPGFVDGVRVVMLGCSTGREAYLLSAMVGANGKVYAFDPKESDIQKAKAHLAKQTAAFGYEKPNIEFAVGFGERIDLDDGSVDAVVVNALFNASPDQDAILDEVLRILTIGGEMYLTSVFVDNIRLSCATRESEVLRRNYLSGAMYSSDIRRKLTQRGIYSLRYMEKRAFDTKPLKKMVDNPVRNELKRARFYLGVMRTFKLYDLEDSCENYKLKVTYNGKAPGYEQFFDLDETHRFFVDEDLEVCSNTFAFVTETRFAQYFSKTGNRDIHYGIYDYCGYCSGGLGGKIEKPRKGTKCKNPGHDAAKDESARELCRGGDCASCG